MSLFRPDKLSELVGCEDIKKTIDIALQASIEKNSEFPHTLIYGPPGVGKTTLANIIAQERGADFKSYLSNVFKSKEDVRMALIELNQDNYDLNGNISGIIKPTILFLDEIHQLSTKVQEAFFQAMEDNRYTTEAYGVNSGRTKITYWIPKFTLLGSTSRAGDLDEAFISRFKLIFTLQLYSQSEIMEIIRRWCRNFNFPIDESAILEISKRSRGIARKALNFTERCKDTAIVLARDKIDTEITEETFGLLGIDSVGLEEQDRQVLVYLYRIYPQKIGTSRLAMTLNISENVLKDIIEPYLLRIDFVRVGMRGREISELGRRYCEEKGLILQEKSTASVIRRIQ